MADFVGMNFNLPKQNRAPLVDFNHPDAIPRSWIALLFAIVVIPYATAFIWFVRRINSKPARFGSAVVLVLGDFGRSPRMMYHAKSLVSHNFETFVVAYGDTEPIPSLLESPHIHFHYLSSLPFGLSHLPWPIRAPLRLIHQSITVLWTVLITVPVHTEFLIVQNPPSIPTLILAQFISLAAGSRIVIDWHNEGWSVLAMRLGRLNPLVKLARLYVMCTAVLTSQPAATEDCILARVSLIPYSIEGYFGQSAYAHLFVTSAMSSHLKKDFGLFGRSAVLYDRPPSNFRRTDAMQQHELFHRILPDVKPPLPASLAAPDAQSTVFTNVTKSLATLRSDRPALLVSSTSWTADEDFSLLLTALDSYQARVKESKSLPPLLVLITGKGPLRAAFEKQVAQREKAGAWTKITVRCVFVEARDYPVLLGCADLGISLHKSTSGRDLPMKVVDMFGCGVPVLAKKFECIGELVKEGKNGRLFDTGEDLGREISSLLSDFPNNSDLSHLRSSLSTQAETPRSRAGTPVADPEEWTTWEKNWDRVVFKGILRREKR